MSAALLHGPLQVCTANHLTSMLRKELVRNSSEVEETLVPPSPCLKGVLLRLFLDCSLTAQQHKSYLLSPVKFFSPEHTCRSYDEASCSSGNTSGMQREATHVQSMCQAGAKNAMGLDAAVELARKTAEASVRTESQRPSLKKRQKLMCVKKWGMCAHAPMSGFLHISWKRHVHVSPQYCVSCESFVPCVHFLWVCLGLMGFPMSLMDPYESYGSVWALWV